MVRRPVITERALRPIAKLEDFKRQLAALSTVVAQGAVPES
jgi:hypothetical protein